MIEEYKIICFIRCFSQALISAFRSICLYLSVFDKEAEHSKINLVIINYKNIGFRSMQAFFIRFLCLLLFFVGLFIIAYRLP